MEKKAATPRQIRDLLNALGRRSHDAGQALSSKDRIALALLNGDSNLEPYNQNQNIMKYAGLASILGGLAKKTAPVAKGAGAGLSRFGSGALGGLVGGLALPAIIGGGAYLAYKNPAKAKELARDAGVGDLLSSAGKEIAGGAVSELKSRPQYGGAKELIDNALSIDTSDYQPYIDQASQLVNTQL